MLWKVGIFRYVKLLISIQQITLWCIKISCPFQRYFNTIFLRMFAKVHIFPYENNIIIAVRVEKEALVNPAIMISQCKEYRWKINLKSVNFWAIASSFRTYCHLVLIETVLKFQTPQNLKRLQNFIGLTGYFRKFSIIAKSLNDLTKWNRTFFFFFGRRAI